VRKTVEIEIPKIERDATANLKCYFSKEKDMKLLDLPWELVDNWQEKAIAKMDELRKRNRALQDYLDICVRCGACTDKCHFFLGTGDPKNMPAARAELLRSVFRRYFTISGKIFRRLVGARELTKEVLDEWYTYFYQCSQCRRCSLFCPYGIDTAEITGAAREIMASVGYSTKYITEVIAKVYTIGNNLGMIPKAMMSSIEFMEEEMKDETGLDIKMPMDKKGAEILLVPPSADLFANFETGMGYAKFFHALGVDWTLSSHASEAGNFGLFYTYKDLKKVNKRIVDACKDLGVKKLIIGECGHAWRAAYDYMDTMNGPLDFLDPPRPQHILEYAAEVIRAGKLKFDKSKNDEFCPVTYHDPCNLARAGGASVIEEPRYVLKAVVNDFRDMTPNREESYCCGGGGGMLTDELMDARMKGAKPKVECIKATGAKYLAAPCAIDKAQFGVVMDYYKLDVKVGGVIDLVGNALVLEGEKEKVPEAEEV
jgi:Fe-S oxidoreductase